MSFPPCELPSLARHSHLKLEVIFCVGAVVSPLLANIYINRLVRHWRNSGASKRLGQIVSYADDFVILCRSEAQARESLDLVSHWLTKLGLAIHPDKTRLLRGVGGVV